MVYEETIRKMLGDGRHNDLCILATVIAADINTDDESAKRARYFFFETLAAAKGENEENRKLLFRLAQDMQKRFLMRREAEVIG